MKNIQKTVVIVLALVAGLLVSLSPKAQAASADAIDAQVRSGLRSLYAHNSGARILGHKARAILVFPSILKGGFMVAGSYGEGALVVDGRIVGYYATSAGSYGFQAGIQQYGYAMFFMNDSSLRFLNKTRGWAVGTGPSVVVGDSAFSKSVTTNTLASDVYALFFNQSGLMAGMGLQGSKITRIYPN